MVLAEMKAGTTHNFITNLNDNFNQMGNELDKLNSQTYPVGSVWIGGKKNDIEVIRPESIFDGSWELIDKSFASTTISNTKQFNPPIVIGENGKEIFPISCTACTTIRTGSTVRIQLTLKLKDLALTDTSTTLGKFDFDYIGISEISEGINAIVVANDGANCAMVCKLRSDGSLEQVDLLGKSSLDIPSTAQTWIFDIMFNVPFSQMSDRYCDKFYWIRTA